MAAIASSAQVWTTLGTRESYLRIAALSIFVYDYLATLPQEWKVYARQTAWYRPSASSFYYALTRYSTLCFLCLTQALYFHPAVPPDQCERLVHLSTALRSVSAAATCLVFLWRTCRVWPSPWIALCCWSLWLTSVALNLWIIVMTGSRSLPGISNCISTAGASHPPWLPWITFIVFDVFCFVCIWVRLARCRPGRTPWRRLPLYILRSSLGYIAATVLLNLSNVVFFALPASLGVMTTMSSLSAALTAILAQRLITSLHSFVPESDRNSVTTTIPAVRHIAFPRKGSGVLVEQQIEVKVEGSDDPAHWRGDDLTPLDKESSYFPG